MNMVLDVATAVSVVFCVIGIVIVSCWLLLDWQRETQRARAAARMASDYPGDVVAGDLGLMEATEYTWPILAQQPPVFYEKAVTIPIPRCLVAIELLQPRTGAERASKA